jgi:hypothetical protein
VIIVLSVLAGLAVLVHFISVGVLFNLVSETPLRDDLFRQNQRKPGYALRSSFLLPWSSRPELFLGHNGPAKALRIARLTAVVAVICGMAVLLSQLLRLLLAVWHGA